MPLTVFQSLPIDGVVIVTCDILATQEYFNYYEEDSYGEGIAESYKTFAEGFGR